MWLGTRCGGELTPLIISHFPFHEEDDVMFDFEEQCDAVSHEEDQTVSTHDEGWNCAVLG